MKIKITLIRTVYWWYRETMKKVSAVHVFFDGNSCVVSDIQKRFSGEYTD